MHEHSPSRKPRVQKKRTYLLLAEPLQHIMQDPLDIWPCEQGYDDEHNGDGNLPEKQVRMEIDRPHGFKVHALTKTMVGQWLGRGNEKMRMGETYEVSG